MATNTADKVKGSGKALAMVQLTDDLNQLIVEAAAEQKVSRNRWITEQLAKIFNYVLPEAKRKASGLRARFELANPRQADESDTDYAARYKTFKDAEGAVARQAHASKVKQGLDLLEAIQAAQEKGEPIDVAALLADLKA